MLCVYEDGVHGKVVCCMEYNTAREFCWNNTEIGYSGVYLHKKTRYPFPQRWCKSAPKSGQAELLQADIAEDVFACSPRGSMIPSSH